MFKRKKRNESAGAAPSVEKTDHTSELDFFDDEESDEAYDREARNRRELLEEENRRETLEAYEAVDISLSEEEAPRGEEPSKAEAPKAEAAQDEARKEAFLREAVRADDAASEEEEAASLFEEAEPSSEAAAKEPEGKSGPKPPKEAKKKGQSVARRLALPLLIAVGITLLLLAFFSDRIFHYFRGDASYKLVKNDYETTFAEGLNTVQVQGNQVLRCSQDGARAMDDKGRIVWDVPFTMASPYMVLAGEYVSVADRLGMNLITIRGGSITSEIRAENTILLNCVNEEGKTAIVMEASDGHIISLYDHAGALLMQRRTFSLSDGVPVAMAISADGSRMATVYVNYTGIELKSILTVFDLSESGSTLVDRILGSASFEGCLISDIRFVGSRCFFVGSDRFGVIDSGRTCDMIWEETLSYEIAHMSMGADAFAFVLGGGLAGTAVPATTNVYVYNYSGEKILERELPNADYVDVCDETLIIGEGRNYEGYSISGSPKWSFNSEEIYTRLMALKNGKTVAAYKNNRISYYDVVVKSAVGENND